MSDYRKKSIFEGKQTPVSFSSQVIARMFKDKKDLGSFLENYENAKVSNGGAWREPTELQYKIAVFVKAGKNSRTCIAAAMKKYSVTRNQVYSARNRVALWEFVNN